MPRRIFLTGKPGVGKSKIIDDIINALREKGIKVAGMRTPEIRKGGVRVGFRIVDIASGSEGTLASIETKSKFKVSKYGVDVADIDRITDICAKSIAASDVIVIDEIGKMEFYSEKFKELINRILKSDKPLIATLHRAYVKDFEKFGRVFVVTEENRAWLAQKIVSLLDLA